MPVDLIVHGIAVYGGLSVVLFLHFGDITVVSKFIVKIVLGFIVDAQFSFAKHAFVHFFQYFGCLEIHASGCKLMGNENHTISFAVFVADIVGNVNAPFNVCNGRVVYERAVFFE